MVLVVVSLILGAIGIILFFLYRWLTSNYGYWESQGVPTVKPQLFYGSVKETFSKPPELVENERYQKYGRLYGTYEFQKRALNIADPSLVRQVLVKDFHIFTNRRDFKSIPLMDNNMASSRDEQWKRIRSVVSPSFTSGKMRKMNCHFVESAEGLIKNFTTVADSKQIVDAKAYFSSYSLDVIGLCAFGIRVESLKNPNHPFTVNSKRLFARDVSALGMLIFFLPGFGRLVSYHFMKKMGIMYFVEVCEEIIRKREASSQQPQQMDFIQLMLSAAEGKDDERDDERGTAENSKQNVPWNITKTLTDVEVKAQAMQFLLAGHETTSTGLAFVAYELAMNPDIQERLYQEVMDAHEKHGEFNYDVVSKMTYLDAVVSETLRLHTVALKLEREASEDYVLGSTGIKIAKGDLIMVLVHAIHHDPEWYPDPLKFQPDRFLPENRSSLTPFTYLPFGDGPRNCVAMRFVLLEMKLCMAMLLTKIKFIATEETKQPIEYFNSGGIIIPKSIKMGVEKRL